jgi:hypothetical protein
MPSRKKNNHSFPPFKISIVPAKKNINPINAKVAFAETQKITDCS